MPREAPTFIAWSGIGYRVTTYDVPLWAQPNRRDGRWNIAGDGATQYFCADPEAPYAELIRHEDLRSEDEASMFRAHLWQGQIDESSTVDYSTFEKAHEAGFPPEALVEDDHERCQAEAAWLRSHGATGLITPSAALPGSVNITLFGPRVEIPWSVARTLASQMPVQRLAFGPPPAGLTTRVRYFGQAHADLVAFMKSRKT